MALSLRSPKAEKPKPSDDADRVAQLTALSASIDTLIRRDDELLKEQLTVEQAGTLPSISLDLLLENPKATVAARRDEFSITIEAKKLLNGAFSSEPIVASAPQTRLDQIIMERAAAQIAVRLGRKKQDELRLALSTVRGAAQIQKWRELVAAVEEHARALVQLGAEASETDMAYRHATDCDPSLTGELSHGFAAAEFVESAREFLGRADLAFAQMVQGKR
jgi:hypothetical protein